MYRHLIGHILTGAATGLGALAILCGSVIGACYILDWFLERWLRHFDLYREFIAFAFDRIRTRRLLKIIKQKQEDKNAG